MNVGREVFEFLKAGAVAHAKWDYEVSMSILKNRKKMLIILSMLLPIFAVAICEGAGILGGKTAYAPAHYTTMIFLVSIAIGLCAGLITGCIGAGGGFIITPALMAAGVKGILAVGTDLFHIFAKAIMGTVIHKKLGNVSVKLAVAFLVGSAGGTFIGGFHQQDPLQHRSPAQRHLYQRHLCRPPGVFGDLRDDGFHQVVARSGRFRRRRARCPRRSVRGHRYGD